VRAESLVEVLPPAAAQSALGDGALPTDVVATGMMQRCAGLERNFSAMEECLATMTTCSASCVPKADWDMLFPLGGQPRQESWKAASGLAEWTASFRYRHPAQNYPNSLGIYFHPTKGKWKKLRAKISFTVSGSRQEKTITHTWEASSVPAGLGDAIKLDEGTRRPVGFEVGTPLFDFSATVLEVDDLKYYDVPQSLNSLISQVSKK
jgi:hypothetical protein